MKIIFRTDASLQIGTGHVMRCLTLADALRKRGCECTFICREHPGNLFELVRQRGHAAHALPWVKGGNSGAAPVRDGPTHAGWLGIDWQKDAEQTRAAMGDAPVDWLIVDHYALDGRWEQRLRSGCRKLMVIDDLADRAHDCDLLLDQNLVADLERRYDGKVPFHCGLMLGPKYALLQTQYAEMHARVPPREGAVRRVLVFFGGTDNDNLTGRTISAFQSLQRTDVALDAVIDPSSPHTEAIRRNVEGQPHITLHAKLPSLAPLMVKADLAVGAGGATSWERCCLALPSLVITVADNQSGIASELHRRGLIRWLGHKGEVTETELAQALTTILHGGLTASWSKQCWLAVDGRGVERVSAILMLDAQTPLLARLARLDDEALILEWANDPLVRRNAFSSGAIDSTTHRAWFRERLRDLDHCRLYVVETADSLPVGQVRFQKEGECWEIHYALDARVRGRGLATPMLQTAMTALRSSTNEVLVFGRVKAMNTSSCRVFDGLGFTSEDRGKELVYFRML